MSSEQSKHPISYTDQAKAVDSIVEQIVSEDGALGLAVRTHPFEDDLYVFSRVKQGRIHEKVEFPVGPGFTQESNTVLLGRLRMLGEQLRAYYASLDQQIEYVITQYPGWQFGHVD